MRGRRLRLCSVACALLVDGAIPRRPVPEEGSSSASSPPLRRATAYSVADLHGDFERFKLITQGLGLASFDASGVASWTGGDAVLVSTGDSVDRGEHSRPIFEGFRALAEGAAAAGGEVVNVLGNHDLMNLQDDLRYVSDAEYDPRGDYGGKAGRAKEWSPDGIIGRDIRSRFVAAAVRHGSVFVHAGLHPKWLRGREDGDHRAVEALNEQVRALLQPARVSMSEPVLGETGPFWIRDFATGEPEEEVCALVDETLRLASARRMVVGHTIQSGGVHVRCNSSGAGPRLILADTAISQAYGPFGIPSAVEYKSDGAVTAIYFDGATGAPQREPLFAGGGTDSSESEL